MIHSEGSPALDLNELLDFAEWYRRESRASQMAWCSVFQEVVACHNGIMTLGAIHGNPSEFCVPLLLAHYSILYFISAVDLALSGQVPACYALQRMCVESIVYAYTAMHRPEFGKVWLRRDDSPADNKRFRAQSIMMGEGKLIDGLPDDGVFLRGAFHKLYETTISYGGHPNQKGVLEFAELKHDKELYLLGVEVFSEKAPFLGALKSTARTGYAVACLEDLMFNVHLSPGALRDRIHALAEQGRRELGIDSEEFL